MPDERPTLVLKPEREKPLERRHPWIFSGAVREVRGDPEAGASVDVLSSDGEFLAQAAYSPTSQIRARVWSWRRDEEIGPDFFKRRLEEALLARQRLFVGRDTDAYRLVHAESDRLPGLVVDRYGEILVMQALSWGIERWKEAIAEALVELTGARSVYERSDVEVRKLEGLPPRHGLLRGEEVPSRVEIVENGLRFWVDIHGGHKTGFYLDQRPNRLRLRELAAGREMLDCFCYSGGFAANALAGGAQSALALDASAEALALARENLALNDFSGQRAEFVEGDVFKVLRAFRDGRRAFDLIVLDPPKFAPSAAQAQKAARGYKDINLLAFKLLRPGGLLVTFSCSGGVDADLFQKIVAGAALDAGVRAQIVERLAQGPDHPVALEFPQGAYLKGLVCRLAGNGL